MKILLTGARSMATLDLSRHLHNRGHTILAVDTETVPISRFSKAVSKYFKIPSPRFENSAFNQRLVDIVESEGVDLLIPTWEETLYIAKILERFPASCEVFCSRFDTLNRLHNKYQFITLLQELGLKTPQTRLIRTKEELASLAFSAPYALKRCYSRGSDAIFKVLPWESVPSIQVSEASPWIAQEWIEGKRYCTYTVCKEGQVLAHTTYPVEFAKTEKFAVTFEAINHGAILSWTKRLVGAEQYTGQIAFDFIETEAKELYAIECNPRITSGVHLFRPEDGLGRAFTDSKSGPIFARPKTRAQLLPGMLMYGWRSVTSFREFGQYLKRLLTVRDTIFRLDDPVPILFAPFLFTLHWAQSKRMKLSMPAKFSYDVEWNSDSLPEGKERLA